MSGFPLEHDMTTTRQKREFLHGKKSCCYPGFQTRGDYARAAFNMASCQQEVGDEVPEPLDQQPRGNDPGQIRCRLPCSCWPSTHEVLHRIREAKDEYWGPFYSYFVSLYFPSENLGWKWIQGKKFVALATSTIFTYSGLSSEFLKQCRGEVGQMKWMDESRFHLNDFKKIYCTALQCCKTFGTMNLSSEVESASLSPISIPPYSWDWRLSRSSIVINRLQCSLFLRHLNVELNILRDSLAGLRSVSALAL